MNRPDIHPMLYSSQKRFRLVIGIVAAAVVNVSLFGLVVCPA